MAHLTLLFLFMVLLLFCGLQDGTPEQLSSANGEQFRHRLRLPKFAVPEAYTITLRADLMHFSFSGSAQVILRIVQSTHFLVFNAANISIDVLRTSFSTTDMVVQPVRSWSFPEDEIFVLEFDRKLKKGSGTLTIGRFNGLLNGLPDDHPKGFYTSKYEVSGTASYMAATQFEPIYARRCFPCWDEPALKATFTITLEVSSELITLSNMPILSEDIQGKWKRVRFQETPVMSTYLVAVVVGIFDYVEASTVEGIKVRAYTPVGKSSEGAFGLNVAVKSLQIYRRFFDIAYPLPKLDMVGIQRFKDTAMENFGLVTFDPSFLYVNHTTSLEDKQKVADAIAHELGHQWCGNIVTMKWWTDLWLNEGFANWLSAYAVDQIFPEWEWWLQFVHSNSYTLYFEAFAVSHPVEVEIKNSSDIKNAFDAIVYEKGASILSMLRAYLGSDLFQHSVSSYVKKFAWSSANTRDLWTTMDGTSGRPVSHLFSKWTKQRGFPVLSVQIKHDCLNVRQKSFRSEDDQIWVVPVNLVCGSYDNYHRFLLNGREKAVKLTELKGCSCTHSYCPWIKLNVNQTGYYRVRYSRILVSQLDSAVQNHLLSKSDEYGIKDDLRALNQSGGFTASRMIPETKRRG